MNMVNLRTECDDHMSARFGRCYIMLHRVATEQDVTINKSEQFNWCISCLPLHQCLLAHL